jgi:hypothetical protein
MCGLLGEWAEEASTMKRVTLALFAGSLAVAHPARAQQMPLLGYELWKTGPGPTGVLAADLDGDGRLDVAAACVGFPASVTVLLNQACSGFATKIVTLPAGGYGPTIARLRSGDLDGDGKPELLYVQANSQLCVLRNDGSGGFPTIDVYSFTATPTDGAVADLDGDGDLDVAVANGVPDGIALRFNDGTGALASSASFSTGAGSAPSSLCIADITADGHDDLVVGRKAQRDVAVFAGNGAGGFTFQFSVDAAAHEPKQLRCGDVNGDGSVDVVVRALSGSDNTFGVYLAKAHGGLQSGVFFPLYDFAELELADLNSDGRLDVVSPTPTLDSFRVWLSTGASGVGVLSAPTLARSGMHSFAVASADLQGDGHADLVLPNSQGSDVGIFPGNGSGAFDLLPSQPGGYAVRYVALGDVNGDGKLDAVTANLFGDDVSVFMGAGDGSFGAQSKYSVSAHSSPNTVALGDLDHDGDLDLATSNYLNGGTYHDLSLLFNNGAGQFGGLTHVQPGAYPDSVRIADLDLDGNLDLIVASSASLSVRWLAGTGQGNFSAPHVIATPYFAPVRVAVGDVDSDGLPDVAAAGSGGLAILHATAPGVFAVTVVPVEPTLSDIALGDVDGDGDDDVAVSSYYKTKLTVLASDGMGGVGPPQSIALDTTASAIALIDLDGDGRLDLVSDRNLGAVNFVAGDGQGGFGPSFRAFAVLGNFRDADGFGDLDGNGRADLVSAASSPGVSDPLFSALNQSDRCPTVSYCTAKMNSQGCLPMIAAEGCASTTSGSGFTIRADFELNNKSGLLLYGLHGPGSQPFSGGTLCVAGPVRRTPASSSGGNPAPAVDCSGVFAIDFNAFIASGIGDPGLQVPGSVVHAQWWGRDPGQSGAFKVSLSNALAFTSCP